MKRNDSSKQTSRCSTPERPILRDQEYDGAKQERSREYRTGAKLMLVPNDLLTLKII